MQGATDVIISRTELVDGSAGGRVPLGEDVLVCCACWRGELSRLTMHMPEIVVCKLLAGEIARTAGTVNSATVAYPTMRCSVMTLITSIHQLTIKVLDAAVHLRPPG
jgi:hypothetical protein